MGSGMRCPMGRAVFEGLLFKILTRHAHQGLAIQQPHYDNKLNRITNFPGDA